MKIKKIKKSSKFATKILQIFKLFLLQVNSLFAIKKSKKKKAIGLIPFVAIIAVVFTVSIILYAISVGNIIKIKQKMFNYYAQTANENIQLIKQMFEKTALFWGIMKTTDELATYGGVSQSSVANANSFCPTMKTDDALFWAIAGDNEILKRIPFIFFEDKDLIAGDVSFPLLNTAQHEQYLDEVSRDVYTLSIIVQLLFLKPGKVNISLSQGGPDVVFWQDIDRDGIYQINLSNSFVTSSTQNIEMHITADANDVAKIKQVAVCIYNRGVIFDPNNLLNNFLALATNNLKDELGSREEDIILEVGDFEGSLAPKEFGPESYIQGLMWASDDEGITATIIDPFFGSGDIKSAFIRSRGLVDEYVYVRYWYLYDAGVWFVNNLDGLVKGRIWEKLNELEDYYHEDGQQSVCCKPPKCPDDPTPRYDEMYIHSLINATLLNLTNELNTAFSSDSIQWSVTAPNFDGCPSSTNPTPYHDMPLDSCSGENFQHNESKNVYATEDRICRCACRTWSCYINTCHSTFAHRYIIKNLPIFVKITDSKYTITDSAGNKKDLVFKFFVEIDKVDDNYCNDSSGDGFDCQSLTPIDDMVNPYGEIQITDDVYGDIPLIITDVYVSDITNESSTISWKATKSATSTINVNGKNYVLPSSKLFSQYIDGLTNNTLYRYTITITGAENSPYIGSFTTKQNPPPSPCSLKIIYPQNNAVVDQYTDINISLSCPDSVIVPADIISLMISGTTGEIETTITPSIVAPGNFAWYNISNYDLTMLFDNPLYYIVANLTKDNVYISDMINVALTGGFDSSIYFDISDSTANITVSLNKDVLNLNLNNPDGNPSPATYSRIDTFKHTFNFSSLLYDRIYYNETHNYSLIADAIEIAQISFRTDPKITTPTTKHTASVVIDTTRNGLTIELEYPAGTTANYNSLTQSGRQYKFNFSGLENGTRYPNPSPTEFYTLTINDASLGLTQTFNDIWFETKP